MFQPNIEMPAATVSEQLNIHFVHKLNSKSKTGNKKVKFLYLTGLYVLLPNLV